MDSTTAKPWLTIVVLCYNQALYAQQCLASVARANQLHPEQIEVLVTDDSSTDGSVELLTDLCKEYGWPFYPSDKNVGNCKAFNKIFAKAKGRWVLDLAADDMLAPQALNHWSEQCRTHPDSAFIYGNAIYIGSSGEALFYEHEPDTAQNSMPEGDIFSRLFEKRFICPSSVVFNLKALLDQGGYREDLNFEDFNIWMELTRKSKIYRTLEVVTFHRVHRNSFSNAFTSKSNETLLRAIVAITDRAFLLAENTIERAAMISFTSYHARLAAYTNKPIEYSFFKNTLRKNGDQIALGFTILSRIGVGPLYRFWLQLLHYARVQKGKKQARLGLYQLLSAPEKT
jgi:glycosyltransferase involved in cell wall biosynthesis